MIFRLVEAPNDDLKRLLNMGDILADIMKQYRAREKSAKSYSQKEALFRDIINKSKYSNDKMLEPLVSPIIKSIDKYGSDEKDNDFLGLVKHICDTTSLTDQRILTPKNADKFEHLYTLYERDYLSNNAQDDFYVNPSLYKNNLEDFKYIVNAYTLITNEVLAEKYFRDTSELDPSEFLNDNGTVKSKQEIHDLMNEWYRNYGEDESSRGKKKEKAPKVTIDKLFDYLKSNNASFIEFGDLRTFVADLLQNYSNARNISTSSSAQITDAVIEYLIDNKCLFTVQKDPEKIAEEMLGYVGDML